MAFLQWRRFNFFEKEIFSESKDQLIELAKSCQITCSSSGQGYLILGDSLGLISFVTRQHSISSFTAYKIAVTHCASIKTTSTTGSSKVSIKSNFYLITIGTDNEDLIPILKIWDGFILAVKTQSSNVEQSTSETGSNSSSSSFNGHSIRCTWRFNVGYRFQRWTLSTHKGELIRDRDRNLRIKLLEVSQNDSVTNVAFATNLRTINKPSKSLRGSSSGENIVRQFVTLFVSTRKEICSYNLTTTGRDKDHLEEKFLLDAFGSEIGASCLKCDPKKLESIQFIVGRKDAIYFYNTDGRGPCLAYEGQKLFLTWFRNYLVVITLNDNSNLPKLSKKNQKMDEQESTTPNKGTPSLSNPNPNLITIYDIEQKFIAFSCPIPAVSQLISEWSELYAITTDGRVIIFKECDIQTKLEILFKKNQFSLAIDLARTQIYSQDVLADMFKQYGDHLYQNGDYDGAINQYCQTLGYLEPSYVIRKFLDLQRIHNLTSYLQEIHKRDLATEDHTTLLINCYVKLKDESKLNEFLRSSDLVFDVEIAIRVLRQAGYYDNAILLARKHRKYDSYFSILLEDKADSRTVLDSFTEMIHEGEDNYPVVGRYLRKFGRMLMADEPDKSTELLKQLCLFYMKKLSAQQQMAEKEKTKDSDSRSLDLLTDLIVDIDGQQAEIEQNRPEKYLHIFLNHHSKMIEFLEYISDKWKKLQNSDSVAKVPIEISNTLLEMYMHSYKNEIQEDGLAENRNKIMAFLQDPDSNFDIKKAMILCQMSNFIPGVLFLYEKSRMYKQILTHFIQRKDSDGVMQTCRKFADKECPQLWVDSLQYFAEIYNQEQKANITTVLEKIEQHQLLPPLMVIEIISKPGKVTLGVCREYLMQWIKTQQAEIDENDRLIDEYRDECERTRKHIDDIQNKPKVFQATKCAACSHVLELPSVHFMCNHSFHLTCFESYITDNDQECPSCLQENRKILNEISMFDNVKNVNDLFQKELLECRGDPFDVIARYCSQGLFNPLTVVTDDGVIQSNI
ncbi:Vacuolar protein sorting-associated protein 11 [Dermatophagoides farinae]|uniref:Vacuolar protein sorting-associated protein 11 homolog n=1 Tax=Dermatophagoides farinae TaxID=6954 RepID=A0A922I633_DERFA|nr:Vacuolar protein sorting-associated protein 11 [Dermatophagoides farinae]